MWFALIALLGTSDAAPPEGVGGIPGVAAALPPAPLATWAATIEADVVSASTWAARRERVTAALATADGERAARLGQTLAVLASLERTGRSDASVVRLFVRASLADDPAVRAAAVDAASRAGDPPLVAATGASTTGAGALAVGVAPGTSAPSAAPGASPPPGAIDPITTAAPGSKGADSPTIGPAATSRIPGVAAALPADPPPATPVTTPAAAPTDAALSTTSPTIAPPTASRPPPSLETLRAYKARRLVRSGTTVMGSYPVPIGSYGAASVIYTADSWKVSDGGGAPLTGQAFARATGDTAKLAKYRKRVEHGWVWTAGLGLVGTVMLGGFAVAAAHEMDAGAAVLLIGGTGGVVGAFLPPIFAYQYRNTITKSYTPAEVDGRIESYNARLREELGLTEADVQGIDLGARAPAGPSIVLSPLGIYGTF